jgi:flagellar basal-body rod protein FlgG
MIRSLWIAKTGLDAQQTQLDVISNNLANTSTNGFKRARAVFEDLLYQTLRQPGAASSQQTTIPSGLQIGTGVRPISTERIFTQGNLQQTGNALDLAINGQGFFQIQMPDGTFSYTRDGAFQQDSTGQVVTSSGYPLSPAITIPSNATSVSVSRDGIVSITQPGSAATTQIGTIQVVTFINNGGLQSAGENLFLETASSGTPTPNTPGTNGAGLVNQGYVETSNVNVAEELVQMIQTQRAYELNSKAIQTSDNMLGRLTQLGG